MPKTEDKLPKRKNMSRAIRGGKITYKKNQNH